MEHRVGLKQKVSSQNTIASIKTMQVFDEQSEAYYNFINSLSSESTRKSYKFCMEKFLNNYEMNLVLFLKLRQTTAMTNKKFTFC